MGVLHLVERMPEAFWECLAPGDQVLLLGDAVYALERPVLARMRAAGAGVAALAPDLAARGLEDRCPATVTVLDYGGFVDLTVTHSRILSW